MDRARRAEQRGFSGLATIDRVVYPSFDSLAALAAAAGATTRIGLLTNVLLFNDDAFGKMRTDRGEDAIRVLWSQRRHTGIG